MKVATTITNQKAKLSRGYSLSTKRNDNNTPNIYQLHARIVLILAGIRLAFCS